jgi:hypothetical protein
MWQMTRGRRPVGNIGIQFLTSREKQRLDRAAFVHRAVALGDLVERQRQVEHLRLVDLRCHHEARVLTLDKADVARSKKNNSSH